MYGSLFGVGCFAAGYTCMLRQGKPNRLFVITETSVTWPHLTQAAIMSPKILHQSQCDSLSPSSLTCTKPRCLPPIAPSHTVLQEAQKEPEWEPVQSKPNRQYADLQGIYVSDMPDGEEHHSWSDGSEYYGEWREGQPSGRGIFVSQSGQYQTWSH